MKDIVTVLIVEDNEADSNFIEEMLKKIDPHSQIKKVSDGEEAMQYIRQEGKFKKAVRPNLIILDLELPFKHGLEVLSEIKKIEDCKSIPIVIYSSAKHNNDQIYHIYKFQANSYVTKSFDNAQSLATYWLKTVQLPNSSGKRGKE